MSTADPGHRPSWGAVAGAQLRMLALLQRREFVILGLILVAVALPALWGVSRATVVGMDGPETFAPFPFFAIPFAILAAVWPLGVWRRDSPERRGYFWSLPVPRGPHTLLRVAMGWVLLMIACLVVMAAALGVFQAAEARFESLDLRLAWWYAPLATATLAYVLMSFLTVALEGPVRAALWTFLAVLGLRLVAGVASLGALGDLIEDVLASLARALLGPIELAAAVDGGGSVGLIADLGRHYLIWAVLGTAALALAAYRHRDSR